MIAMKVPRFDLGRIVSTPGALEALQRVGDSPWSLLSQHVAGQWGIVCDEDRQANEEALTNGDRLLSAYLLSDGTKLWVITESDRSSTCLLLPEEY
jgi:hypothetical protein